QRSTDPSQDTPVCSHASQTAVRDSTPSSSQLPLEKATTLQAPDHKGLSESVLVAAPLDSDRRVLVIGRRGGPEFLGSEVARLSYLASLAVTIRATA
ncbi:hypothetical protein EV651_12699, partial [Kribbella sp. VKM Ac-2571]